MIQSNSDSRYLEVMDMRPSDKAYCTLLRFGDMLSPRIVVMVHEYYVIIDVVMFAYHKLIFAHVGIKN